MTAVIYKIENYLDGKVYIGSTVNFKNRWKCHRYHLRVGTHHSRHLQFAWNRDGEESFWLEIIAECDSVHRVVLEQYWMDAYSCCESLYGYNVSPKAESCAGRKHSEETRRKMSISASGKTRSDIHKQRISESQRGRICSLETRQKLSKAGKGRKLSEKSIAALRARKGCHFSDEVRAKISEKAKGRRLSDETKEKISAAGMGRRWTPEQREKLKAVERAPLSMESRLNIAKSRGAKSFTVTAPDGTEYHFDSLSQVTELGLDKSNVQKCLTGRYKTTRGYKCEYKTPHLSGQI